MPYHEIPISRLSLNQIHKLLRGERIRVKHGNAHKLHLSSEQHKKVMAAHRKGNGCTIQFDPYQMEMHKSHGFFDNIGKAISRIAHSPIAHKIIDTVAPIALDMGKKYLESITKRD